ncbi:MAG: hypothetical protein RLY21_585 [Planctomycetota bacterium]
MLALAPRAAHAQPTGEIVHGPRGMLYLDSGSLMLFPETGDRMILAWLDGGRDIVVADDGVLVASATLGLFGYTAVADEIPTEGVFTKPLWEANVRNAAVAADGAKLMALGTAGEEGAPANLVRVLRDGGAWKTEPTDIPSGAEVLRLERANDLWVAMLRRAASADLAPTTPARIELWSSADGLDWTRSLLPARAVDASVVGLPTEYQIAGGNGVFVATAGGRILVAETAQARNGALAWREAPQVFGVRKSIASAHFSKGQFVLTSPYLAMATSPDARAWEVRRFKKDVSPNSNGAVSVNGELKWTLSGQDGTEFLATAEQAFEPADQPAEQFELSNLVNVEQLAPAPGGEVAVTRDYVWLRRGNDKPVAGFFVGTPSSMAANPQGVVVANERVGFMSWDAFGKTDGKPESTSNLIHAAVAADPTRFLAVGVDPDDASGKVVTDQRGANGAWTRGTTNLGDDVTPLAMTNAAGGWIMLARRAAPAGNLGSRPQLEVLASQDGAEWRAVGEPISDVASDRGPVRYAVAVGPSRAGDALAVMAVAEDQVSTSVGGGAWTTRVVWPRTMMGGGDGVFATIDRDGTMYWTRGTGVAMRSEDGANWFPARFRDPKDASGVKREVLALCTDAGAVRVATDWRTATSAATELFVRPRVDRPAASREAALPLDVTRVSRVIWNGDQLLCAARGGLLASDDGARFEFKANFKLGGIWFDLGTVPGAVVVWPRRAETLDDSKAFVVEYAMPESARESALPIIVSDGVCADDMVVLIGGTDATPDSRATVAWSLDAGLSWKTTTLPSGLRADGASIVRAPFGWTALCAGADGTQVLAISRDLVEWRVEPIPYAGPIQYPSLRVMGDKVALHGSPSDAWMPQFDQMAVTTDGTHWSTRAIPSGPFAPNLVRYGSSLFCSEDGAVLTLLGGNLVSDDLERWRALNLPKHPNRSASVSVVGDVVFQAVDANTSVDKYSATILCTPLPTRAEAESIPFMVLEPVKPKKATSADLFALEVVRWDEKMVSAKSSLDRVIASDELIESWRKHNPDESIEKGAEWTFAVILRVLGAEMSEESLQGALRIAGALGRKEGVDHLPAIFAEFRKRDAGSVVDLLEDVRGGLKGNPRKFAMDGVQREAEEPMLLPLDFDLHKVRFNAGLGTPGAAYDLTYAYGSGTGLQRSKSAAQFWMLRAQQTGFFDDNKGNPFAEAIRSIAYGSSINMMLGAEQEAAKPDSPEPTPKSLAEFRRRAAELGSWRAMTDFAFALDESGGSPEDWAEARASLRRAASRGYGPALTRLARDASRGQGVLPNGRLAAAYLRLAADRGDVAAMLQLAAYLKTGACVPQDQSAALALVAKAGEMDPERAEGYRAVFSSGALTPALTIEPVSSDPPQPGLDLEARLREARAGNAAACWDVGRCYRYGLAARPNATISAWWERKAISLGWQADASLETMIERGSIVAFTEIEGTRPLTREQVRELYRQGGAAKNLLSGTLHGIDLVDGVYGPVKREEGIAILEDAARQGIRSAASSLGDYLLRDGSDEAMVAKAIERYAQAAAAGEQYGALSAASLLLLGPSPSDAKTARALRILLQFASIDEPKGVDPSKDFERYRRESTAEIAAWAEIGLPEAMAAQGLLLLSRDGPKGFATSAGRDWLCASELQLDGGWTPGWLKKQIGRPDGATLLRAAQIAWACRLRLEQRGCLPTWSARAANSAPERSKVAQALRALFDHKLDEKTALEASQADEIFAIPSFEALRARVAREPSKIGNELLAAMLGVDFMFETSPIDFLRLSMEENAADVEGASKADLVTLVAAMHYYGIGTSASRPTAAAALLLPKADIDRPVLAGFAAQGIKAGESGELQAQLELWIPKK